MAIKQKNTRNYANVFLIMIKNILRSSGVMDDFRKNH